MSENKNSYKTIKEKILEELKQKLESGELPIDKYFYLRSIV